MKTCTRYSHESIVMITAKDSYALKYTIATGAACTRELNLDGSHGQHAMKFTCFLASNYHLQ